MKNHLAIVWRLLRLQNQLHYTENKLLRISFSLRWVFLFQKAAFGPMGHSISKSWFWCNGTSKKKEISYYTEKFGLMGVSVMGISIMGIPK